MHPACVVNEDVMKPARFAKYEVTSMLALSRLNIALIFEYGAT